MFSMYNRLWSLKAQRPRLPFTCNAFAVNLAERGALFLRRVPESSLSFYNTAAQTWTVDDEEEEGDVISKPPRVTLGHTPKRPDLEKQ